MADVPRRLPLTPEERLKIVATSVTPSAAARGTRFARPVNSAQSLPRSAEPTAGGTPVVQFIGRYSGVNYLNWTGSTVPLKKQEWAEWTTVQKTGDLEVAPALISPPTSVDPYTGSGATTRVFQFTGPKCLWLLNLRGRFLYNMDVAGVTSAQTRTAVGAVDPSFDIMTLGVNIDPSTDIGSTRISTTTEHSHGMSYVDYVSSYVTWSPTIHGMPMLLGDGSFVHLESHSTIPKTFASHDVTFICMGPLGDDVDVTIATYSGLSIDFDTFAFAYESSGGGIS